MLTVQMNTAPTLQFLKRTIGQVPFAASRALNATALEFQARERNLIEGAMTVRRQEFVRRQVKIPPGGFATKVKLEALVEIDPHFDLLQKFEAGGTKRARGGGALAVPVDDPHGGQKGGLRSSVRYVIPRGKRPKGFEFQVHRTKAGKIQYKGLHRTFIIERGTFDWGILQRVGKGKRSEVRVLYWSRRSVPIPASLHFQRTAVQTFRETIRNNLLTEWAAAIRKPR